MVSEWKINPQPSFHCYLAVVQRDTSGSNIIAFTGNITDSVEFKWNGGRSVV
jgi:hypothetical protein